MFLLKSQKNELHDLIVNEGFDPLQFELKEYRDENRKVLSLTSTTNPDFRFYFIKRTDRSEHCVMYSPGEESQLEKNYTAAWH